MLSLLVFLPVVFALVVWVLPEKLVRISSLIMSVFYFLFSLTLLNQMKLNSAALQLVEKISWVEPKGINYFLGIDGISLWLILLSTFLIPIIILGSWSSILTKIKGFHITLFLLASTMIGTFLAMDAILFYTFFEASLVPMYFMVGIWGGKRRIYATVKFFIYTMAGSVFMLLAIIALMFMTEAQLGTMSASILDFYKLEIPFISGTLFSTQTLLFFAFCVAFAIKVPAFPFHTWLPDAHVEAPTPGSVILAGVMLKMGTYGFLRFSIPIFPQATEHWSWVFLLMGVIGIIYGALVAMVQPDMKKLVAYSSVSHMGYILIGLFAMNEAGVTGGLYQMLNHGVSTGALFLLVGMIYERTHSREISAYGGLAKAAPIYSIFFVIVTLSSIAVPMTNGFIGEFLILLGTYLSFSNYAYFAVVGVILGAAYMLWMVKKVFFGEEGELIKAWREKHGSTTGLDMSGREMVLMIPLVILIFWMGLAPGQFIRWTEASIKNVVKNRYSYELVVDNSSDTKSLNSVSSNNRQRKQ